MIRILIADDDPNTRYLLRAFCRDRADIDLTFVSNGQEALERIKQGEINALVADIRMPIMSGDALLDSVKKAYPSLPVVIMTGYGSIEDAVDFLHRGAEDYLAKPLTREVFLHRLGRVIERVQLSQELTRLRKTVRSEPQIVGQSEKILSLINRLPTIAQTDASVVIFGESGTGKEIVARSVHQLSRRETKPYVTVNCGSLPETLLESELFGYKKGAFTGADSDTRGLVDEAHTGTLFLDEIGEISLTVQVKLLRFLQEREYKPLGSPKSQIADVRIVSATNRDLRQGVAAGTFREDLFYRLNIIPIELPPLRDRKDDIPLLATHFLERFNQRFSKNVIMRQEAFEKLQTHAWPGNIRELENKIEQLAVMAVGGVITPEDVHLPTSPTTGGYNKTIDMPLKPLGLFKDEKRVLLEDFEKTYLERLLEEENGHVSRAALRAGLDRKNLWQLMQRHGLNADDFKSSRA